MLLLGRVLRAGVMTAALGCIGPALGASPEAASAQGYCAQSAASAGYEVVRFEEPTYQSGLWRVTLQARRGGAIVPIGCTFDASTRIARLDAGVPAAAPSSATTYPYSSSYPATVGRSQTLVCESVDDRPAECPLPFPGRVSLVRQQSRSDCIEARTWGVDTDSIWVSNGCRAEFEVRADPMPAAQPPVMGADSRSAAALLPQPSGVAGGDDPASAVRACLAQAQSSGYFVENQTAATRNGPNRWLVPLLVSQQGARSNLNCAYDGRTGQTALLGPAPVSAR